MSGVICGPKEEPMNCPRCDSPQPHLHPAMQFEGEIQPCPDPFHDQITASNTPAMIAGLAKFRQPA